MDDLGHLYAGEGMIVGEAACHVGLTLFGRGDKMVCDIATHICGIGVSWL